jgi:hypothetical protein
MIGAWLLPSLDLAVLAMIYVWLAMEEGAESTHFQESAKATCVVIRAPKRINNKLSSLRLLNPNKQHKKQGIKAAI